MPKGVPIQNEFHKGQWVRLKNGFAGYVREVEPPGKPGMTIEVSAEGERITAYKTSVACLENPNTFNNVPRSSKIRGASSRIDLCRDGEHPADEEE